MQFVKVILELYECRARGVVGQDVSFYWYSVMILSRLKKVDIKTTTLFFVLQAHRLIGQK